MRVAIQLIILPSVLFHFIKYNFKKPLTPSTFIILPHMFTPNMSPLWLTYAQILDEIVRYGDFFLAPRRGGRVGGGSNYFWIFLRVVMSLVKVHIINGVDGGDNG